MIILVLIYPDVKVNRRLYFGVGVIRRGGGGGPSLGLVIQCTTNYDEKITCIFFRLVPDVDVEIQAGNLSRVSSVSRINIMQSEANVSRGVTSTEFLSDAPSENNSTGSSTVPGQFIESFTLCRF